MKADSDAALVARVVADDDRAAFELLVRRHQSPLRAFLRRLVRNDAARADDLAQETFIKLFRSMDTYRAQAKFSTWLYRIAYRTFLDDWRRRAGQQRHESIEDSSAPDTAGIAANEWDSQRAMEQLSERQRAVFDLFYGKGMTHDEVARALDAPVGTIKSDLRRGIERLRQVLLTGETSR